METKEQKIENFKILKDFIAKETVYIKWLKKQKGKSKFMKEHLKYWETTLKNAKQEFEQREQELKQLEEQC